MDRGAFVVHTVSVRPGASRAYENDEWRDSLVIVAAGQVELVGVTGWTHSCAEGDVLALDRLTLRCVRNIGRSAAVLVGVARARGLGTAAAESLPRRT